MLVLGLLPATAFATGTEDVVYLSISFDSGYIDDKNGNPVTFKVSDILDNMTEADALTMTQAAIWTYSNGSINTKDGKDGTIITGKASDIMSATSSATRNATITGTL